MTEVKVDRETLSYFNIVYEGKVFVKDNGRCSVHPLPFTKDPLCHNCSRWELPGHVDAVRELLLDLTDVLSSSARSESAPSSQAKTTLSESLPFRTFCSEHLTTAREIDLELERAFIQQCRNTVDAIPKLKADDPTKLQEWTEYYQQYFLKPLVDRFRIYKGIVSHCRASYSYDSFVWTHNQAWNSNLVQMVADQRTQKLEVPCPTFAFYFPVLYSLDCIESPSRNISAFAPVRNLSNFHDSRLKRFLTAGLKPTPFGDLRSSFSLADESSRASYPWLVVQVEAVGNGESCIRRAGVTATASLEMYRNLSQHLENKNFQQVPPMPVLTATGSDVRLWLAYMGNTSKKQMVCIWEGSMKNMIAVLHLRVILDNLHTWAMRCLRPCIESYLEQWRLHQMSSENATVSPFKKDDPNKVKKQELSVPYEKKLHARVAQSKDSPKVEIELTPALEKALDEMINKKLQQLALDDWPVYIRGREIKPLRPRRTVKPKPSASIHEDQRNSPILFNANPSRPKTPPSVLQKLSAALTPPTTPTPKKLSNNSSPVSTDRPGTVSKLSSSGGTTDKELLVSIQELEIQ